MTTGCTIASLFGASLAPCAPPYAWDIYMLLQSKGLEFDDVFLVNFCTDSPAKEEWRVLLQVRVVQMGPRLLGMERVAASHVPGGARQAAHRSAMSGMRN